MASMQMSFVFYDHLQVCGEAPVLVSGAVSGTGSAQPDQAFSFCLKKKKKKWLNRTKRLWISVFSPLQILKMFVFYSTHLHPLIRFSPLSLDIIVLTQRGLSGDPP